MDPQAAFFARRMENLERRILELERLLRLAMKQGAANSQAAKEAAGR